MTAQDTSGTPTQTKHNIILARLGNLLYLQSWTVHNKSIFLAYFYQKQKIFFLNTYGK